jgi:PAS domain S-box-containing protein
MRRWSVERKIGIGFALGPVMLAIMAVITLVTTTKILVTQRALLAAYDARSSLRAVEIDLLNAETGQRGYLLTGKAAYLAPYRAAITSLNADLKVLASANALEPLKNLRTRTIRRLAGEKVAELQRTIALRRSGATAASLALVDAGTGKVLMDRIRAILATVESGEQQFARTQFVDDQRTAAWAFIVIAAGSLFTVLALIVLGILATCELRHHQGELARARDELEGRVQVSDEKFRGFLTASPDAMLVVDEVGDIVLASERVEPLFGYAPAEIIGRPFEILVPGRLRTGDAAHVRDLMRVPRVRDSSLEQYVLRKDGTEVLTEMSVSPHQTPAGLVVIVAIRDITLRKRMEAALQQSQKMEAVGQLTSGVAHDFNNILGGIIGNLDLLSELIADDPKAARYAEQSLAAALSGAALVKRMLAFSRRQPLRLEPLDLRETIASVTPLIRRTVSEQISIVDNLADGLWLAMADPSQIENAVLNLAINARDAMPEGGVLSIECRNMTVEEDVAPAYGQDFRAGDYVVVSVTDTGHGMTPDVAARAFDPFFTTKEHGVGTGLGLSMVLGTMSQSGGTARIYSELGHGTTVRLYLPRTTDAQKPETGRGIDTNAPSRGDERVLVVEDDERIRSVSCAMLTDLGYCVESVESADEALARITGGDRFDLVFSDVVMPGAHTGLTLARELRALDPSLKIVLTSGYTSPTKFQEEIGQLGIELISKPFRKVELAALIRRVLDEKLLVPS